MGGKLRVPRYRKNTTVFIVEMSMGNSDQVKALGLRLSGALALLRSAFVVLEILARKETLTTTRHCQHRIKQLWKKNVPRSTRSLALHANIIARVRTMSEVSSNMLNRTFHALKLLRRPVTARTVPTKQATPMTPTLILREEDGVDRASNHTESTRCRVTERLDPGLLLVVKVPPLGLNLVQHSPSVPRVFVSAVERGVEELLVNVESLARETSGILQRGRVMWPIEVRGRLTRGCVQQR